ncbi:MAG: hypothetical protein WDM86_12420 [Rhizomicrobium sp.]
MSDIHRIRYRRPETPWSLSQMTTQNAVDAAAQIKRLQALGYTVADVVPPLAEKPSTPAPDGPLL